MKYSNILSNLCSGSIDNVISILEKSVYVTDFKEKKDDIVVLHSGFVYSTQSGKEFEILICFYLNSNEIVIIRQPRSPWDNGKIPLLNGMQVERKNYYFDQYYDKMITKIFEYNDDYTLTLSAIKIDNNLSAVLINHVQLSDGTLVKNLIVDVGDSTLKEFPLQTKFKMKIFFDGKNFSKLDPNNNEQFKSSNESYDQWLRDEFGEDAGDAFWNNE